MAHYDDKAIEHCKRLYIKFNGKQHHRIEQEMRKAGWVGWSAKNLHNRGKGDGARVGWIEKYGFERALEIHLAQQPTAALNNAQKLVREIEYIREALDKEIKTKGVTAVDIKLLYLHRDYCKLCIDALTRVEAARDTLGGFVSFYERFIDWMTDIDARIARKLLQVEDLIIARAEKEFAEDAGNVYRQTVAGEEGAEMNGNPDSTVAAAESGAEV
jgi:hypothetical protein